MSTAVKQIVERPIRLKGWEVRAVLDGHKAQVRELIKIPAWLRKMRPNLATAFAGKAFGVTPCLFVPCADGSQQRLRNPWNWPEAEGAGRLWVREALRWSDWLVYDVDRVPVDPDRVPDNLRITKTVLGAFMMPRYAARTFLEITSVRAERLRDISESDIRAEGITPGDGVWQGGDRAAFRTRWDANVAHGNSWEANPWVWVVDFKKIDSTGM